MLSFFRRFRAVDVAAGLFLIVLGGLALAEAARFQIGSARSIGPGYFPFYLGLLLIALGIAIMFVEGRRGAPEGLPPFLEFKPLLFIAAAMLAFSLLVERAGLVPALAAAVLVASLAERRRALVRTLMLVVLIPLACYLIFGVALGLHIPALRWPTWT